MNLPVTQQLLERDRYVRRRTGIELGSWFGRTGITMDDLDHYIWEVAKNEGKKSKMRRSGMYASIFYQAAADLGDSAIPFHAANRLLDRHSTPRWYGRHIENEIFGHHPMTKPYRKIFTTTFTTREEIEKLYEQKYRCEGLPENGRDGNGLGRAS